MSKLSRLGAIAGLLVLIGAAGGPAYAKLSANGLWENGLSKFGGSNALTPTGLSDVGSFNGVAVEGIVLPPSAGG